MSQSLSSTTLKVLDILNDCKMHTGTDIASNLGISRTAVWKIIQHSKKYDVHIRSHHQGYQLTTPLFLFDKKKITNLLKAQKVSLEILENISSTTDYLKKKKPLKDFNFCLAEHQSKGRGRLGRTWFSPFGRNIYCSFSYTFNKDASQLSGLSLVLGLAIIKALESLNPDLKLHLKWPNDIYYNNEKMGGILIDLLGEANGNCTAIMSVGLNINMKDLKDKCIDQPWTSLEHALKEKLDRNIIVARLIQSFQRDLDSFQKNGFESFLKEWKKYDLLAQKKISIVMGTHSQSGTAQGINEKGYLLLKSTAGKIEEHSFGDTHLK
ncbi:MAG: biotin--[acetyl-CoA-carboxylase] ligase [Alphaproteobacteria bacterium]|nr:biotin--[acetyl-CoA-carboxylase] ligase [Alphaproteobacteria bacterium]